MRRPDRFRHVLAVLVVLAAESAHADTGRGALVGRVVDASGAALPGAIVTLRSPALAEPFVTFTDGVGTYDVSAAPVGPYRLRFELDGFEPAERDVAVAGGVVTRVDQTLALATMREVVEVVGHAPPKPPPPPPPAPRVVADLELLPVHAAASVCGPGEARLDVVPVAHVAPHRDGGRHLLYGPEDAIRLDRGSDAGVEAGQHLVVRRRFRVGAIGAPGIPLVGEYTAALIQVVDVEAGQATAAVVYACSEIRTGDHAAPFEPTPVWKAQPSGVPDHTRVARVIFGDEGQSLGSPRRYMVIDRGALHETTPGQRVTLFRSPDRPRHRDAAPLGEGIVVAVAATSARIWISSSIDAVEAGDLAVLHTTPAATHAGHLAAAR